MKLEKLREIAMAATQGCDHIERRDDDSGYISYIVHGSGDFAVCCEVANTNARNNTKYIATFSPEMVLKLLEVIDAAEECLEGFTRHPHPAMKYYEHQVRHGAHEDFAIALAALKETE